uniref:DISP complex protein LRCH3-like n=1 Tax=Myxine glutinosa TaxID=7769 RepID=UPI00358F20F7
MAALVQRSDAHFPRSLELSLEEAQSSGALNLSGRKLKEFPLSAALYDLSDTLHVDLSKNCMHEVALEVCQLVCLESLELHHNRIRTVPEHIANLRSLTYLNISWNQLTVLPGSLCRLPLQVLNASNNNIFSLPKETDQLKELLSLDVSCNKIQALPQQVSGLIALRDLSVRRNNLVSLPDELADLGLIHLDFSCNRVLEIPVSFRKLHHLQTIVLDHNPLRSPPGQVCIKGKHHIFKYLNIEARKQSKLPDLQFQNRFGESSSNLCLPDEFLAHRPSGLLDSGFNSVDSGNKRWSGNEEEEKLPDHKGDSPGGNPFGLKLRSAFTTPSSGLDGRDPTFTVKRQHTQALEEMELIEQLKKNIESRLKTSLPGDPVNLGSALMDGVILCHLMNQIRPCCVPSIHVPSPDVPKLTMAKCRHNVENFLEACKKLGMAQDYLCLPQHILEEKGLLRVALTVQSLVELVTAGKNHHSAAV